MKKHTQVLLLAFIAANPLSLNGMLVNTARRYNRPIARTASTLATPKSVTPEANKLKNIPMDLPQTWYQELFGIKKANPEWSAHVDRAREEKYLLENARKARKDELAEQRAELENKLNLIRMVENAIPVEKMIAAREHDFYTAKGWDSQKLSKNIWFRDATNKLVEDSRIARYVLGLYESPWYAARSDYGHKAIEEDTQNVLKLKMETIKELNAIKAKSSDE